MVWMGWGGGPVYKTTMHTPHWSTYCTCFPLQFEAKSIPWLSVFNLHCVALFKFKGMTLASNTYLVHKVSRRTGVIDLLLRTEVQSVFLLRRRSVTIRGGFSAWCFSRKCFGMHGVVSPVSCWWVLAGLVFVRESDPVFHWRSLSWRWRMIDDLSLGRRCGAAGPSSWPQSHGHHFVMDTCSAVTSSLSSGLFDSLLYQKVRKMLIFSKLL